MVMEVKDALRNNLEGERLANALDLVDYLIEKGLTPKKEFDNGVRFIKNEKSPCMVVFFKNAQNVGEWFICDLPVAFESEWNLLSNDLKKFIVENVKLCNVYQGNPCGCGSEPGVNKTIFGKDYNNVCTSEIQFINPESNVLDKLKQIIEWWLINVTA